MSVPCGVVAIGRNEGERLLRCLDSVTGRVRAVVYVDSGSTDDSVAAAAARGAEIVTLDLSVPFTAARARNAGFERLIERHPELEYVQFVDGDCEVVPDWLETAAEFLDQHDDVCAVYGRRRERFPEASAYNRLIDMEWDTPVGESTHCGGDMLMRAAPLAAAGGFNPGMIAGEEPELGLRLRQAGHRMYRLDREMTLHDAAVSRFGQWWRRSARSGHAYSELYYLHGRRTESRWARNLASSLLWAGLIPFLALLAAWPTRGLSLAVLGLLLALQWVRIYDHRRRTEPGHPQAALFATGCLIGKFAVLQGMLQFAWNRLVRRKATTLIEYK